MLHLFKSSIVLKVLKPDDDGEMKEVSVTLANVRTDLTTAEIKQLIQAFQTLISHQLSAAQLAQFSYVL